MLLTDRVALITGAASGIGRASARLFAWEGARVLLADLDVARGTAAAAEITAAGGTAKFVATDVSKNFDAARAVAAAVEAWGRLDILYNNAAPTRLCNERDRAVDELDEAVWDTMINVALKGVFLMSKHALPVMKKQKRGVILNTATINALVAEPGVDSYTAAKGGVVALTRSMALNYAKYGIRVNTISPRLRHDRMPGRLGQGSRRARRGGGVAPHAPRPARGHRRPRVVHRERPSRVHDRQQRRHGRRLHRLQRPTRRRHLLSP